MSIDIEMQENEWKKTGVTSDNQSLMTPMSIIEGEILEGLEMSGSQRLGDVVENSTWPKPLVMMGVGALIREGLVSARKSEDSIVLTSRS